MQLTSSTLEINTSIETLFSFLDSNENFKDILPENHEHFEVLSDTRFLFQLKAMPKIALDKKQSTPSTSIQFTSPSEKLSFDLEVLLSSISDQKTQLYFSFTGEFTKVMEVIVKNPLKLFLEALVQNCQKKSASL